MRRLNDALRRSNAKFDPVFIGTSATLQAAEDTDPKAGIAQFFTRLTGQGTPSEAIITEVTKTPQLPAGLTLPPPPIITGTELNSFDQDDPESPPGRSALTLLSFGLRGTSFAALPFFAADFSSM